MSTRTTGSEYKSYINDPRKEWWPDGSFIDDVVLIVNGRLFGNGDDLDPSELLDSDSVVISYGSYFKSYEDKDPIGIETHFKRWKKAQSTARISVEISKDKLDDLIFSIKSIGGRVSK